MAWFLLIFPLLYFIFFLFLVFGWFTIPTLTISINHFDTSVSVIVAARNEDSTLADLLLDLKHQQYPRQLLEILLVDDHSENRISELFHLNLSEIGNIRVFELPAGKYGKKEALALASIQAKGELLLFTDADCRLPEKWVQCFVKTYQIEKPDFIAGLVDYLPSKGWLNIFMRFELIGLLVSSFGAIGLRKPVMCNGANMAVRKESYLAHQQEIRNAIPSGDDVFLLHALKKNAKKIIALKEKESIVSTYSPSRFLPMFNQRMRWASKAHYYNDKQTLLLGTVVFGANFSLAALATFSLINFNVILLLLAFGIKTIADCLVIAIGYSYFRIRKRDIPLLPIFEIFYAFLSVIITVFSIILPYSWKGRRLKNSTIVRYE